MNVKLGGLKGHVAAINAVLNRLCQPPTPRPLVEKSSLSIVVCGQPFAAQVTNDLGIMELALPLPVPTIDSPNYWVGLHEKWQPTSRRHEIAFVESGLRLFTGTREQLLQLVRLEWVTPRPDDDGELVYKVKHAGHPHWHIDRTALAGPSDYWRTLDVLTKPDGSSPTLEDFGDAISSNNTQPISPYDCSWLNKVHFRHGRNG